jgi:methylated-DNA-[protein]-cysteine S-methyltransferase
MTQNYTSFDTVIGSLAIAWTEKGICRLQLAEETSAKTVVLLKKKVPKAIQAEPTTIVQRAIKLIKLHLEGMNQDFRGIPLDLSQCTEFSRMVYEAAREVLAGQVVSYANIANRIGSPAATRAVGRALGCNPVAIIIPCHRIIGKSGNMSGFSAYGGCDTKLRLLSIEGACSLDKVSMTSRSEEL